MDWRCGHVAVEDEKQFSLYPLSSWLRKINKKKTVKFINMYPSYSWEKPRKNE